MLTISDVSITVSNRFKLEHLNLTIEQGEHVAIIGESGCGKTTFLKLIYGLYDWDKGSIRWKNNSITGPEENLIPGMSYMKYLSQDFELMPFISVEENVQKFLSRLYPKESAARTAELLEVVEMSAFAKAHVKTLSGGQKQRVALAQTLAKEPEVLLLDEPFSHIDNFRKNNLRRRLFTYLKSQNITCLVATHDATDVLSFMDRTVVMHNGKIIENAPTLELYKRPQTYYIASLFGEVNNLPAYWFDSTRKRNEMFLCYPHELHITEEGMQVEVTRSYFKGSNYLIEVKREEQIIYVEHHKKLHPGLMAFLKLKHGLDI